MRSVRRLAFAAIVPVGLALSMVSCSSSPDVGGVDANALIAACLNGAETVAAEDDTVVDGTISSFTSSDSDSRATVVITINALSSDNEPDPAACSMVVADGSVTSFGLGPPEDVPEQPELPEVTAGWNEEHADRWRDGESSVEPAPAPSPTY